MAQSKKSITKKPLDSIKSKFTKNIDQVQSFIDDCLMDEEFTVVVSNVDKNWLECDYIDITEL